MFCILFGQQSKNKPNRRMRNRSENYLIAETKKKQLKLIAYESRYKKDTTKQYANARVEILWVLLALEQLRCDIKGRPDEGNTDNHSLQPL